MTASLRASADACAMWRKTVSCCGLQRVGRCKPYLSCTSKRAGQLSSASRQYRWCFCTADAVLPLETAAGPATEHIYYENQISGSCSAGDSSSRQAVAAIEAVQHVPSLTADASSVWPAQNTVQLHPPFHQQKQHDQQLMFAGSQHVQQQHWQDSKRQTNQSSLVSLDPPVEYDMPVSEPSVSVDATSSLQQQQQEQQHGTFAGHDVSFQPGGAVQYPPIGRREGLKQANRMAKQLRFGRHVLLAGGTGLQQVRGVAALAATRSLLLSGNSGRGLVFQPSFSRQQQQQQLEIGLAGGSNKGTNSSSSWSSSKAGRRASDTAMMLFVTTVPEQQLRRFDQHPLQASGRGSSSRLASAVFARLCSQGYTTVRAAGTDAVRIALLAAAEARRKLTRFRLDLAVVPAAQYEELAEEVAGTIEDWQQQYQQLQPTPQGYGSPAGYGPPADVLVGDGADPVVRVTVLHFIRCEPRRPWELLPWRVPIEQMPSVQRLKQQQQQQEAQELRQHMHQQEAQQQLLELRQQQSQLQQRQGQEPAAHGLQQGNAGAADDGVPALLPSGVAAADRHSTASNSRPDQTRLSSEGNPSCDGNPSSDSSLCNVVHLGDDDLLMFPSQGASGARAPPGPVLLHKQHNSKRQLVAAHSTAC